MEQTKTPEQFLEEIHAEEGKKKGHLTIFFGYAAGVGKTYAMLEAAHLAIKNGKQVMVGYVEPHSRPQTTALLEGLPTLPCKECQEGKLTLREFDLDGALDEHPEVLLVDELAHTNAKGCRHEKRYQDIYELLEAGIDVYTTVNVQHIESLNDQVAAITGVYVRERIPDKIFDGATTVKLVDIEPEELKKRLEEGLIYRNEQARRALVHFFTTEHLTALREIATRRCADRMNYLANAERVKKNGNYYTNEHILVCISSSPSNPKIIRTASKMAKALGGKFTAIYVETPSSVDMEETDRKRLLENMRLAKQLGAVTETAYGDDRAFQIAEYARMNGISKVVLGRNNRKKGWFYHSATLVDKLTAYAPGLDIYIIPVSKMANKRKPDLADYRKDFLMVIVISIVCVLGFNFFFTEPFYTFNVTDPRYPITFSFIFFSAFFIASLSFRLKRNEQFATQNARRTRILLEANQALQNAGDVKEVISITMELLNRLSHRSMAYFPYEGNCLRAPQFFGCDGKQIEMDGHEIAVAKWVAEHNRRAGATTSTLPDAKNLYLAVRVRQTVYGVLGIRVDSPIPSMEYSILLSIVGECALGIERLVIRKEKEQATLKAQNEHLKANILRSISHDLRTPLTAIAGDAANLVENDAVFTVEQRKEIYSDIKSNSTWLIQLVENLLSVSRITDGKLQLNQSYELMADVMEEVLQHYKRSDRLRWNPSEEAETEFVKIDVRLIIQVLTNLIDNAFKYSEDQVEIFCEKKEQNLIVRIQDHGYGIREEDQAHIFEMFYIGKGRLEDSSRSMGIGLALCRSIIEAHGGKLYLEKTSEKGSVFAFELKIQEVPIHE